MKVRHFAPILFFVFHVQVYAHCYAALTANQISVKNISTRTEDTLLVSEYAQGVIEKDKTSLSQGVAVGCFVTDAIALEVAYAGDVVVGTRTDAIVSGYGVSTPITLRRDVRGALLEYALTAYTGNPEDTVRGYMKLMYLKAYAKGVATLSLDGYFIGMTEERRAEGPTVGVGLSVKATSTTRVIGEYIYVSGRAEYYKLGVQFSF